jgi:nucleoside-diphosphate-sugar epimerase
VPTLVAAAAGDASVIPLTAGTQPRDFVYVEDAADAMLRLGVSAVGAGDIVNVATGILRPVREFVECAADALGIARTRLQFGVIPERPGEMRHEPVRVTRLHALTGWLPTVAPAEGIRRTQAYSAGNAGPMRTG